MTVTTGLLLFGSLLQPLHGQALRMTTSLPSPQPVGTLIQWRGETSSTAEMWYRFRVRHEGGEFLTIRDFGPESQLDWTFAELDGAFEVEVSVRAPDSDQVETQTVPFRMTSRAANGPVVNPTAHPLVILYSATPCAAGSKIRAVAVAPGGQRHPTPYRPCVPERSTNFYVAGLHASTTYTAFQEVENASGEIATGPSLSFHTGSISAELTGVEPVIPRITSHPYSLLLTAPLYPNLPTATDLDGRVVWYYPGAVSLLTRAEGGRFWGVIQSPGPKTLQRFREFDLTGMTLRETNAARINEQLRAMGKREISGFHHEARSLPDGRVLALASNEQIMTDVQGPGDVNIVGDVILVMDKNLQVEWVWDGFDHLDPTRAAILDEKCSIGACPPIYLDADGNDWTHINSVQLTPDGAFVASIRHLDQVIKINYANGHGDGAVLWTFGRDGDFYLESTDADPWFSHQHDAAILPNGTMILFDNGNVRHGSDPSVRSRGQVFRIDEVTRSAELLLNADLGAYHFALGSAQVLPDGTFHFGAGWILPENFADAVEVDGTGAIWYSARIDRPIYRSFRLPDLYTPE